MRLKFYATLLLFIPLFTQAQTSTKGTEFWLGFMENLDLVWNNSPTFFIQVYGEASGTGTFSAPANPGLEFTFTYDAGEIEKIQLPLGVLYALGTEEVRNFGFRITTDTPVIMQAIHARAYFSEATMLLPRGLLGSRYRAVAVTDFDLAGGSYASFVVISTEDSTMIEITPSALTLGFRPANVPFNIVLNAGESYQVQAIGDLSGTLIEATDGKKIAVFGGARQANVYCSPADSHVWDQLYPDQLLGHEYVLVPYAEQGISLVKIVATEDNTELMLDNTAASTLQAGETYTYNLTAPIILNSNYPVQVALIHPSYDCTPAELGDPNMIILAPTDYRTYRTKFWLDSLFYYTWPQQKQFVTLIAFSDGSDVILDGVNVGGAFTNISGTPGYSYFETELSVGEHELIAEAGVLGYAYGFVQADAYTYHLGFESIPTSLYSTTNDFIPLKIFPNPIDDHLRIENLSPADVTSVQLYDIHGRKILDQQQILAGETLELDLSDLPGAMYFLNCRINEKSYTKKLIKK